MAFISTQICDRCGKNIERGTGRTFVSSNYRTFESPKGVSLERLHIDLCSDCLDAFGKFMKNEKGE